MSIGIHAHHFHVFLMFQVTLVHVSSEYAGHVSLTMSVIYCFGTACEKKPVPKPYMTERPQKVTHSSPKTYSATVRAPPSLTINFSFQKKTTSSLIPWWRRRSKNVALQRCVEHVARPGAEVPASTRKEKETRWRRVAQQEESVPGSPWRTRQRWTNRQRS